MENFCDKIISPTAIINLSICKRNIDYIFQKCQNKSIQFRPHFKTHQSALIGNLFKQKGIEKCTVSSVQMALYFSNSGWNDITIAFPVNIREIQLIEKIRQNCNLNLLFQDEESVQQFIQKTTNQYKVWIKVDVLQNQRTGISLKDMDKILNLAKLIINSSNLTLEGLLLHEGQSYNIKDVQERVLFKQDALMLAHQSRLELNKQLNLNLKISFGDTPSCSVSEDFIGVDELRPGNFIFYDMQQLMLKSCQLEDISILIACPVVTLHPERNEIIIYGGAVHFSKDSYTDENGIQKYGQVVKVSANFDQKQIVENVYIRYISQEHGVISCQNEQQFNQFHIGDLVYIIPAHSCLAADNFDIYISSQGEIIDKFKYKTIQQFN